MSGDTCHDQAVLAEGTPLASCVLYVQLPPCRQHDPSSLPCAPPLCPPAAVHNLAKMSFMSTLFSNPARAKLLFEQHVCHRCAPALPCGRWVWRLQQQRACPWLCFSLLLTCL